MNLFGKALGAVFSVLLLLVAGCGGGGGGSVSTVTVSGVAATGAPIIGTVTLKDKNGVVVGPVATGNDGSFSVDVTKLTPPFILKAEWTANSQANSLYSAVTGVGTANINPLTHLALQLATNSDPATVFGGAGNKPDVSKISEASMSTAQGKMKQLLDPLLTKYGVTSFAPVSGAYTATPDNKLDTMLDAVSIQVANGNVSIANKLDGTTLVSGSVADVATMSLDMTKAPDAAVLTDIKDITAMLGTFRVALAQADKLTVSVLDNLFIPQANYGTSSGQTRAADIASVVAIFGPVGGNKNGKLQSIGSVRLESDLTASYSGRGVVKAYLLNYDFVFANGVVVHGRNVTLGKETTTGQWKLIGDPNSSNQGDGYGAVTVNQGRDLSTGTGDGGGITEAQVQALTLDEIRALMPAQLQAASATILQWFTAEQLGVFSTAQLLALSVDQVKAFTPTQLLAFTAQQRATLAQHTGLSL